MQDFFNNSITAITIVGALLAVIAPIIASITLHRFQVKEKAKYSSDVEAIVTAVKATAPSSTERREEEWEVVRRLVNEYHRQALSQARVQFWFSVVAASSGFALIIVAVATLFLSHGAALATQSLQIATGILIEAVAALFFKQAAETRERATALYDRLRTDRERAHALTLVESINNANLKNAIKAELALHMTGLAQTHLLPRLLETLERNPDAVLTYSSAEDVRMLVKPVIADIETDTTEITER